MSEPKLLGCCSWELPRKGMEVAGANSTPALTNSLCSQAHCLGPHLPTPFPNLNPHPTVLLWWLRCPSLPPSPRLHINLSDNLKSGLSRDFAFRAAFFKSLDSRCCPVNSLEAANICKRDLSSPWLLSSLVCRLCWLMMHYHLFIIVSVSDPAWLNMVR